MTPAGSDARRFLTTHWSVVVSAGAAAAPQSREALEQLCTMYWRPVYAYVRRSGVAPDEAADLTQAFFAMFLEKHFVRSADPARGRFRSFLLASVRHFLCNEWDRARAKKRGGDVAVVPLEVESAERELHLEPATRVTPERVFEHRWALAVVARALEDLAQEQARAGKADAFVCLRPFLLADGGDTDYTPAVTALGSTPGAVRVAVHRLRRRLRAVLLEHVGRTVADPSEIDAELRYLARAVRPPDHDGSDVGYV